MEIQRVAALMKKKCTDLGETASRDDISRVYANTLEEEWPALSTTTASKDDARWMRRIRYTHID